MRNLPCLEKESIKLIPPILTQKNIDIYNRWLDDSRVKEGIGLLEKISKQEIYEFLSQWKKDPLKMHWFIYSKNFKFPAGDINLDKISNIFEECSDLSDLENYSFNNAAEIKIMISGDYQRQGIGRLAAQSAIDYGFKEKKLDSIYAFVYEDNIGSKTLWERLGFEKIGSHIEKVSNRKENTLILKK